MHRTRLCRPWSRAVALLCASTAAFAQAAAPSSTTAPVPVEPAVVLSPFEVNSTDDKGYAASSALAGTRTNEKLANLPNSISVFTADLMSDLALNDFFGAVEFAAGAENIFNDTGTVGAPVGSRSGNQISFRGIPSIRQLRDGFPWFLPADTYNTERIEFARGPGGLAYGDVDPTGIINVSTKRANFRRSASTTVRYDNFGTQRYSVDINQPVLPRLGVRFNALNSEVEQFRQRGSRDFRGYAGALRWEPFKDRRTRLDANYEGGHTRNNQSTLHLNDGIKAYVRGTGTNAADADPNNPGVQVNGIGMRRIAAPGNTHVYLDIGGTLYDMQSTATTTFRNSAVLTGATVATGTDPQNPVRYPLTTIPYSVYPDGQDWGGPDNRHDTDFHAYNIELSHSLGDHLRFLVAHNGQVDATTRLQTYSSAGSLGMNSRAVFIDVNRVLPHPTVPNTTIPNPRFEQLFLAYAPTFTTDGNKATGWRTSIVYDTKLPFWSSTFRAVAGANYRHEQNYLDTYSFALTQQEIARRGLTGAAATFANNVVNPIHYLADGNSDEALRLKVVPGVTGFYRSGASQTRFDQTLGSGSLTTLASFFKQRLHTSAGISRDYFRQNRSRAPVAFAATGETRLVDLQNQPILDATGYNVPYEPFNRTYATNQTYGGVFRVLPWLALGGGYFESSLFTDSVSFELTGRPRLPRTGEGHEYSLRFNFLDERISATVTRFQTTSENNSLGLSAVAQTELNALLPANNRLLGTGDYRDQETEGWEIEMQMNLTRQWTVRATYSMNRVVFGRFFPLVRPYLAAARAAAQAQGLDPEDATAITQQLLDDTEGAVRSVRRETANITTRYSFTEGRLRGFAIGASARYALGRPRAALSSGGVVVLPATTTDSYFLVNPFTSYRRKIYGHAVTLQLNVNNVLGLNSDQGNSYTWPRKTEPRQYVTTATVEW
ncbi:TonB-dependent siderophore receptor [Horticoccus sp. 23ND18S-11]|uniref:TonB-dependent siderophore receptor n=1 Tax=Horticoccus sp. 23ND18S-11 TaxID=3391832 RepID=UPI0039C9BEF5